METLICVWAGHVGGSGSTVIKSQAQALVLLLVSSSPHDIHRNGWLFTPIVGNKPPILGSYPKDILLYSMRSSVFPGHSSNCISLVPLPAGVVAPNRWVEQLRPKKTDMACEDRKIGTKPRTGWISPTKIGMLPTKVKVFASRLRQLRCDLINKTKVLTRCWPIWVEGWRRICATCLC